MTEIELAAWFTYFDQNKDKFQWFLGEVFPTRILGKAVGLSQERRLSTDGQYDEYGMVRSS